MKILEQGIVEIIPVEELCVSVDQNITAGPWAKM